MLEMSFSCIRTPHATDRAKSTSEGFAGIDMECRGPKVRTHDRLLDDTGGMLLKFGISQ